MTVVPTAIDTVLAMNGLTSRGTRRVTASVAVRMCAVGQWGATPGPWNGGTRLSVKSIGQAGRAAGIAGQHGRPGADHVLRRCTGYWSGSHVSNRAEHAALPVIRHAD